ncbi:MAG: bifunctional phosphoglucose/phosphomannose isomerase [Candidatus Yanofskybacteria bacterium]|nr:bifunctional phosphoglucose/phosphomannose isomerase [Candidatus Yanofskybacteria bacterium]
MEQAIREFPQQLAWEPTIEHKEKLVRFGKYMLCGMGGSHLQGDMLQTAAPGFDLSVHQDYGLPAWPQSTLENTLIIASSYSGNTEETLSAFQEALSKGYPAAVISTGGKLLALAQQHQIPYVQIPATGLQPRAALGFAFKALSHLVGREDLERQATRLAAPLAQEMALYEKQGKELANMFNGKVPVIYASTRNYSIAYNWKIKFNETGKIPAFYNLLPELNHNEMNGFDVSDSTRSLCENFGFIFLKDAGDHPRIQKRMEGTEQMLRQRGFSVATWETRQEDALYKIFSSLLVADWASFHTAELYERDPEHVPMIEEFKKLI